MAGLVVRTERGHVARGALAVVLAAALVAGVLPQPAAAAAPDPGGSAVTYAHDSVGRLTGVVSSDGAVSRYAYDAAYRGIPDTIRISAPKLCGRCFVVVDAQDVNHIVTVMVPK